MNCEAERQRWLLAALAQPPGHSLPTLPSGLAPFDGRWSTAAGFDAYRRNAAATAERALAAAYPTVQQLLGADSFAALARTAWRCHPPTAGDLALWHGGVSALIAEAPTLACEPYLADVAEVDWAVHRATSASDAVPPTGLACLGTADPQNLWLRLAAGTALIPSPFPVASIWLAHRRSDAARFDAVRVALANATAEAALVQRDGFRVQVQAVDAATARFMAAVLAGQSLSVALDSAGDGFDFAAWLRAAVQQWHLQAVVSDVDADADAS